MHRFLVAAIVIAGLSLSVAAGVAEAAKACEVTKRADRVWESDPAHVAYRIGSRLYGCRKGVVTPVGSATGVTRVTVNGNALGLLRRRGEGRCRRAEAFNVSSGKRVNAATVGCRQRVLRLTVTTDADIAVQMTASEGRTRIEEITDSRRRVLDARADTDSIALPAFGSIAWTHAGVERRAMLGRSGCRRDDPFGTVRSGPVSLWSESHGGQDIIDESDFTDLLLTCHRRVGTVFVLEAGAATGCAGPRPVALRPPWIAVEDAEPSTHCSDDRYSLRVVELPRGKTRFRSTWSDVVEPRSVSVTPGGGLVFAGPSSYVRPGLTQILYATPAATQTLDEGPGVDPASLKLDGDVASWVSGGQTRSARTP